MENVVSLWQLLSESLDVIRSAEWTIALGDALSSQYDLYRGDHQHAGLLHRYGMVLRFFVCWFCSWRYLSFVNVFFCLVHRCLGILLQKVADRAYVKDKIALMYKQANVQDQANRLGLAMAMGLVIVVLVGHMLVSRNSHYRSSSKLLRSVVLSQIYAGRLQHPTWIQCWNTLRRFWKIMDAKEYTGDPHMSYWSTKRQSCQLVLSACNLHSGTYVVKLLVLLQVLLNIL